MNKIIAIDIGGTYVKIGIIDENKNILDKISIETECTYKPNQLIKKINNEILNILNKNKLKINAVKGIGICCPGPVNPDSGLIFKLPNIPGWKNFNIKKAFTELYPEKLICVNNDANAATIGEWWFESSGQYSNMLFISIGTGFGGGVIINNKLYHGANGLACEFGHMTINPEGNLCGCGNKGCLEEYVSGRGLIKIAKEWINNYSESLLINNISTLTPEIIHSAAIQNDKLAIDIFKYFGKYLGIGLTNLINIFNPECIVFGGGVALAYDLFMPFAKEEMKNRLIPIYYNDLVFRISSLKENAALFGSAAFVYF
jgi:glucokinase